MKTLLFSIGVLISATAFAAEDQQLHRNATNALSIQRADQIIGRDISDKENKPLGEVEDLLVDLESGAIIYGVLDLDRTHRDVAVPIQLIAAREGSFQFTGETAKLSDAPARSKEPALSKEQRTPEFATRVSRHFGQSGLRIPGSLQSENDFGNAFFVRELPGKAIHGTSGSRIGKVDNVVLDLSSGRVAYVIVVPERDLKLGNRRLVFPATAFDHSNAERSLHVNATLDQISSAPAFERDHWPDFSDPAWSTRVYQHFGKVYTDAPRLEPTSEIRSRAGRTNQLEKIYHEPER